MTRHWVVEIYRSEGKWVASNGHIYDNKRKAFQALRGIRFQWRNSYPPETWRISEYKRVEKAGGVK